MGKDLDLKGNAYVSLSLIPMALGNTILRLDTSSPF